MRPFVFENRKPTRSHDHQRGFKLVSKFAASTLLTASFPRVPSLPFASAHMGQAVTASSSLLHLPCHRHPPLRPPTLSTATSQPGSATTLLDRESRLKLWKWNWEVEVELGGSGTRVFPSSTARAFARHPAWPKGPLAPGCCWPCRLKVRRQCPSCSDSYFSPKIA